MVKIKKDIFYIFIIINAYLISNISCDLNIHVIPHTHLDPGWLKTPEEYYSDEGIGTIFNTVLDELYKDKKRTFVINEIYYFRIWYSNISPEEKSRFKNLLKEKRIEFVSGSYVINDEATPLYYNIIDQIRIGHQFLLEEFGIVPKTGWYIDSFGHSAGNAHILSQMNFENLVLGRMHEDFLDLMKKNKKTEFYYKPFGNNSNKKILVLTLTLHYGYELYFQDLGLPNDSFSTSLDSILDTFINNIKESWNGIRHNNIIFLLGDDFKYKDNNLFLNIETIMKEFNRNNKLRQDFKTKYEIDENINIFYSTPQKYFGALRNDLSKTNKNLETFTNIDFYPLRTDCFWTGYFTSRPYLKGYIRKGSNIFYTFSKYNSFSRLINEKIENKKIDNLNALREVVGLVQHHDAITGTCMQYVSANYIERLKTEINKAEDDFKNNIEMKYNVKIGKICYNNYIVDENDCSDEFLISDEASDKEIKLGLYNPTYTSSSNDNSVNILINIEIINSEYEYEIDGITSDFFCINEKSINDTNLYRNKNKCFLQFFYEFQNMKELAYITLKKSSKQIKEEKYNKLEKNSEEKIKLIKKDKIIQSLVFTPKTFQFNLEYYNEDEKINKIDFTYYDGMYYVNDGTCVDGAYIFSPYNKYPDEIEIDYDNSFYYKGNLGITFVTRNVMTSFTIFTIFYNPFFIKVEHKFDSLEKSYFLKRFSHAYSFVLQTNIENLNEKKKPIFYTDSNGIEVMKREIDKHEYTEKAIPLTGGNFYPVTSFISIKDEKNESNKVTIFNDRSQGGTGYLPGSIILILQRMTYQADKRGLDENLYEQQSMNSDSFSTTHLIVFGSHINNNKYKENQYFKYMSQKTDLLNYIYNYFNTATVLFKIQEKTDETKDFDKKILESDKLINDKINKYLKISPDIRANYEIINENLVIGEYFRYNNYYFNIIDNEREDEKNKNTFGTISLNFDDNAKFKIYYDTTGINYNKNTITFNNEIKNKFISPKNQILSLNYNEFLYIYFYYDNLN